MAADYAFFAGIAVSHPWGWLDSDTAGLQPLFAEGVIVGYAQISTLLVPWLVLISVIGSKLLEALSRAARGQ